MSTCICDTCGAEIPIDIQETILEDKKEDQVVEQYFVCWKCGTRYTISIFDNYIRKRIAIRKRLSKSKYNRKKCERLKKEMENHVKELKMKYERE